MIERIWYEKLPLREPVRLVVPWGDTMRWVLEKFKACQQYVVALADQGFELPSTARVRALSMTGLLGTDEPSVEANVIAEELAQSFPDHSHDGIPGSAFVRQNAKLPQRAETILREFSASDLVVLVGAPLRKARQGSTVTFGLHAQAWIPPAIVEDAEKRGAVGEISGLFVDAQGEAVDLAHHKRVGISIDDLVQVAKRRTGRVVLLIGSREEYIPLARALLNANQSRHFITTLVTDLRFAHRLLSA
jgi:DNA-binding transcriptional regulator LsrR (DeoR family)